MKKKKEQPVLKLAPFKFALSAAIIASVMVFLITLLGMMREFDKMPGIILTFYYSIGYTVSITGAFLGAFYAFIDIFILAWIFAWLYDKML